MSPRTAAAGALLAIAGLDPLDRVLVTAGDGAIDGVAQIDRRCVGNLVHVHVTGHGASASGHPRGLELGFDQRAEVRVTPAPAQGLADGVFTEGPSRG